MEGGGLSRIARFRSARTHTNCYQRIQFNSIFGSVTPWALSLAKRSTWRDHKTMHQDSICWMNTKRRRRRRSHQLDEATLRWWLNNSWNDRRRRRKGQAKASTKQVLTGLQFDARYSQTSMLMKRARTTAKKRNVLRQVIEWERATLPSWIEDYIEQEWSTLAG